MNDKLTCMCAPAGPALSADTAQVSGRRGFLSSLLGLGAAALLPGCQSPGASVAQGQPYRIDIHHHVVPPNYAAHLASLGIGGVPKWSAQMSIDDMDSNGIATSVVSLMQPGAYFKQIDTDRRVARESNNYSAQLARDFPGRFGSFAALPLMDTEGSLREIDYALDTLKAEGIGLMTSYGGKYLGDPQFWPIWEELNRRKAVVYTHPLMSACCRNPVDGLPPAVIEYATDTTRSIASVLFGGVASRYPDIKWIWSHSGGSMPFLWSRFTRQELDMKERARAVLPQGVLHEVQRFYFDTAQGHHEGAMAALRALVPASQIMFGSDFPFRQAQDVRIGLSERRFSAAERLAIDRGNAVRIMPRLSAT